MDDAYDYFLEMCACALMCVHCDPTSPWCDFHASYLEALNDEGPMDDNHYDEYLMDEERR